MAVAPYGGKPPFPYYGFLNFFSRVPGFLDKLINFALQEFEQNFAIADGFA